MGRECGKVLLNALGVADVCQHVVKHGDLAALCRRDEHTAHCHQRQQTAGLEGYGLTAGVRTGDDKRLVFAAQGKADGNCLFIGNQRMACLFQHDHAVVSQHRRKGVHLFCQACLGEIQVQLGADLVVTDDGVCPCAALGAEFLDDALDLLRLLEFQQTDVVVGIHHGDGFDKDGLPGGRGVMHQTGDLAAIFRTDRQDKASVTERDTAVLETVLHILFAHHAVQGVPELLPGASDLAADVCQRRACGIGDLLFREDGAIQLFQQIRHRRQLAEQVVQGGFHPGAAVVPVAEGLNLTQYRGDLQQVFQRQSRPGLCPAQSHPHILKGVERRCAELDGQLERIVGLFQLCPCLCQVGAGDDGAYFLTGDLVGGEIRQHF